MRDIQKVLAALTSPVRREILGLIWDRELSAGEIAAAFPVTKPTISQHLAVLREAGLAESTAVGTSRRYRARRDALRGLRAALGSAAPASGPLGSAAPASGAPGSTALGNTALGNTALRSGALGSGALGSAALGSAALGSAGRWTNADDDPGTPDRAAADVHTRPVVVAGVDVDTSQAVTFAAFTDPVVYSRWLGVPVTIADGRFACTMEWGTAVRGRYELVCPPELIAMRWDFEDDNVPIPGGEMTGYLRIQPRDGGSRVEVHQLVDTTAQATFMEGAWALVLGRLKAGITRASDPASAMPLRPARPKHRAPDSPGKSPA